MRSAGDEDTSEAVVRGDRSLVADVSGVERAACHEDEDVGLVFGDWAVLDAARNNVEIAFLELDVAFTLSDSELAFHHEEKLVGLGMLMPDEFAFQLGQLHIVVVERGDDLRAPKVREAVECLGEIDFIHMSSRGPIFPGKLYSRHVENGLVLRSNTSPFSTWRRFSEVPFAA